MSNMKSTAILTILLSPLLLVLTQGKPSSLSTRQDAPAKITVIASRSGEPRVHLLPMQAAGRAFWLGGEPATYCPDVVEDCPPGEETVILGLSVLDVVVPGGQRMYVEPSGAVGFTQAHSAHIPEGSYLGGYVYTPGEAYGVYSFTGWGATGFMGCPVEGRQSLQVFANMDNATVPSGNIDDCLDFVALAFEYTGPSAAWQYI